jgi:hypothetical protein
MGNQGNVGPAGRSRYFQTMSLLLLALTLAGFARTLFLRPLFNVPPISTYLYLHAAVQVSWVVLFAVQTHLIGSGHAARHRSLGVPGSVLAGLVIAGSFLTVLHLPAHFKSGHLSNDTPFDIASILAVFWHNLTSLLVAGAFLATAILLRRQAQLHKRLMLFATNLIVAPAVPRVAFSLGAWIKPLASPQAGVLLTVAIVVVVLPLTLIMHDLRSCRRVHPATLIGIAGTLMQGVAGSALAASRIGQAVFTALE